MHDQFQQLRQWMGEIYDLTMINSLLNWDMSTYMPAGGAPARARQRSLIARLQHEKATDPALGRLLDALQPYEESLPYDSDEASMIRVARRQYERLVLVPADFVARRTAHAAETYQAWTQARPANDFARLAPLLEKTLDLSREYASYFPGYDHIMDPMIALTDYGLRASQVQALFAELRQELVPLVKAITSQPRADDSCLRRHYPAENQRIYTEKLAAAIGYDFQRGRQDKTHHPFMTKFSLGDVRITTRYREDYLGEALFSSIHEAGHAMYEQGIRMDYEATSLGGGASSGVHESQSRLWENVVGRSLPFWEHHYPALQQAFPDQLKDVSLEQFYRAVNLVERSLIRTDADEVTYNLHVMLRFDLEMALLEGRLAIRDLPQAWNDRYTQDLGVTPPDDRDGVLQDVHWYTYMIGGMFQGYTLGNILCGQFYAAALQARPHIPAEIARGDVSGLHGWMKDNIYQHGSKFTITELAERVAGGPIRIQPYVSYLKAKYGQLYSL
jgi:carboxypeptidase Taq